MQYNVCFSIDSPQYYSFFKKKKCFLNFEKLVFLCLFFKTHDETILHLCHGCLKDHPSSMCAKFFEELTYLTP